MVARGQYKSFYARPCQVITLIDPAHNSHKRLAETNIYVVFKVMLLIEVSVSFVQNVMVLECSGP